MDQNLIMPRFYYYRANISDRKWIETRMIEIPEDKRQAVADEYEHIFMGAKGRKNRKGANTYIQHVALEYRQARYGEQ